MKLLFEIDRRNYDINNEIYQRNSSRALIIRNNKIAMVYNLTDKTYEFPGGGIELGETREDALIREVEEETGLIIEPNTIKEFGYVHRIEKGKNEPVFIQDNYFYFCDIKDIIGKKIDVGVELRYVSVDTAIKANIENTSNEYDLLVLRENRILKLLKDCKIL